MGKKKSKVRGQGAGAAVGEQQPSDEMALQACQTGDVAVFRRIVRLDLTVSNSDLLAEAAFWGHLDVVRCIVKELVADVGNAGPLGITAVLEAQNNGHHTVVHSLLKMKADQQLRSTAVPGVM